MGSYWKVEVIIGFEDWEFVLRLFKLIKHFTRYITSEQESTLIVHSCTLKLKMV